MDLHLLLVFIILIVPIQSSSDFYSDGHLSESPAYKYSEQANIEQLDKMDDLTLFMGNACLSILSINLIPVVVIFFLIPTTIFRRYPTLVTGYLSFASGGLMADVFLRLLPDMIVSYRNATQPYSQSHDHHHQHDSRVGLFILMSLFLSFFTEKCVRSYHNNGEEEQTNSASSYLFLFADILYKYTIGRNLLSIFLIESTININGIIIQMIFQVLHLFYGYAVLIHSGMISAKAIRFQLLTAFIGSSFSFVGLQLSSNSLALLRIDQLCLPIIAGIFVYISTVHLIPEVIEHNSGLKGAIFKVGAFIISVLIIFSLNKYE